MTQKGTWQSKTGQTENKGVMSTEVGVRNVSVTHRGGEKPTVGAISLECGIGVKEVHTRKSLNI